ncbi:MAG: DUF6291 domain-containing protein [Herbaspirillum sp.]
MEEKNSFVFYKDWANVIKGLPEEVRLDVYDAVIEYAISGKLSVLKPMAQIAFGFIKQTIDRDTEKYMLIKNKRSESGKKGAERKWQTMANDGKNGKCHVNVNENDNVNENVLKTPNGVGDLQSPERKKTFKSLSVEDAKTRLYDEMRPFVSKYSKQMLRSFFDYWTEKSDTGKNIRIQKEKYFDIGRRLSTWNSKEPFNNTHNATTSTTPKEIDQWDKDLERQRQKYAERR